MDGSGVAGLISGFIIWWLVLSEGGNTGSGAQSEETVTGNVLGDYILC